MAGFQQAANAITGSFGTVAGRVGLYSELVGKNQKLIGELKTANKSLEESNEKITGLNEELGEKNKEISDQYETLREVRSDAQLELDALHQKEYEKAMAKKEHEEFKKKLEIKKGAMAERKLDVQLAHASKNMMINALYGDFASGSGGGI